MEHLIKVEDLCKIYNPGENEVRALDHINLEIDEWLSSASLALENLLS